MTKLESRQMDTYKTRLNPFLFSPNTNFRFALLILSVIGASLFIYETLFFQKSSNGVIQIIQSCKQEADSVYPISGDTSIEQKNSWIQYGNICREGFEQEQARWILDKLGFLFIFSVVFYWFMPRWIIWRDRLTIFSADDDAEIMNCLVDLCRETKLSKTPKFLLRALNSSPSGLAFGRLGRYYVVLNGGLISLFHQSPERFKAIIRHELAHLQNKDIDKTYFSVALGIAFLLAGILPLFFGIIIAANSFDLIYVLRLILSAGLFSVLVYITLASVLRSRETYADVRASENSETYITLQKEFSAQPISKNTNWERLFGLHPIPAWRLKVLSETHLLSQMSYWDAFITGIATTFGLSAIDNFLSTLLPANLESIGTTAIATLILVPFATLAIGIGIWQRVFANRFLDKKVSGIGRLGLCFGLGMLLGLAVSFSSIVTTSTDPTLLFGFNGNSDAIANGIFQILWRILFLIGLFMLFKWMAVSASVWLETVSNQKHLQGVISFGLLITAGVMFFWIGTIISLQKFGLPLVQLLWDFLSSLLPVLVDSSLSNLTKWVLNTTTALQVYFAFSLPFLVFLWTFPLAARLRKSRTKMQNLFIGNNEVADLSAKQHPYLRPFWAFLAGLATSFCFILFIAFLRLFLLYKVAENVRMTNEWEIQIGFIQIYLAIFTQVALAVLVSVFSKHLGWAHGLFAAFVAGCLIQLGIVGLYELSDCVSILSLTRPYTCVNPFDTFSKFVSIVILGTSFSFPLVLVASWISSSFRNLFSTPSPL